MTASKQVLVPPALLLGLLVLALWGALNVVQSGAVRAATTPCVPGSRDQMGWRTSDGHAQDIVGLNHGSLEAWSRWGSAASETPTGRATHPRIHGREAMATFSFAP